MAWRVVVVDDVAQMRWLLTSLLSLDSDFDVVGEGSDGLAAIDVVTEQQPDVVLLDWWMPGVDGLAALPEIRRLAPRAIVVLMSASPPSEMQSWATEVGADGFYNKDPHTAHRVAHDLRNLMTARASPVGRRAPRTIDGTFVRQNGTDS